MDNAPYILKDLKPGYDENYGYLRDEGRKYIEELASALWTDYNEHDPGITILEALCYAITELGYRTSFPIKDLLTSNDGTIPGSQTLFTARDILTQSPLNVGDYRKLLIDIDGVENAWLFAHSHYKDDTGIITPAGEVPLFADCDNETLTFSATKHPVYLRGLYKVFLDLDKDLQFGDLNNGEIDLQIILPSLSPVKTIELTVSFPNWKQADASLLEVNPEKIKPASEQITVADFKLNIPFSSGNRKYEIEGTVTVGLQPTTGQLDSSDIQDFFSGNKNAARQLVRLYISKIQKANSIVQTAVRVLNENRNLCEDFVSVETIRDEEIAFCFDVDVVPSADIEQVEAYIFFAIEQYLDPDVKFYLLNEMLQKTNPATNSLYTVDEIFEGPRLQHGFIDTNELESTNLKKEIYASQIIGRIMDIIIDDKKVILAVRNFMMTAYDDSGKAISSQANQPWCIQVNNWCKPVLAKEKSKIALYKNDIPFLAQEKETDQTFNWIESLHAREKLISTSDDIEIPTGSYLPLDTYTSIQNLFPQTYGVGNVGLPSTVTDERRAQAKQLKAYLLFYDQLLADFFMQLKNARELFSTDNIKQTYYAQFVNQFNDFDSIYRKDAGNNYLLKKNVLDQQDSTVTLPLPPNKWEGLYESNETFVDRRNRFLDHLMARFAESFNDYVFLMYSLDSAKQTETKIDPIDLIESKKDFLRDYPVLSYNRAKAFNYCPLKDPPANGIDTSLLWNTNKNISGLEQRVSLLSGITNYARRFLYCISQATIISTKSNPPKYRYVFKNANSDKLTSVEAYPTQKEAAKALPIFFDAVLEETHFSIQSSGNKKWKISLTDDSGAVLATSSDFTKKDTAQNALSKFVEEFKKECDCEGLYLIEHILLRPRNNQFAPAPVCFDDGCDCCGQDDPYSFRMSIVLPYWPDHFRSLDFRDYFENLARKESPAHTMVKVCWINNSSMFDFANAYKDWITKLANYTLDKSTIGAFQAANDKLVQLLFNLHSEFPVATLHDCDESKDTNPVILGKTVLGTFKN